MVVLGPYVTCHRCGGRIRIEGDGKMVLHNIKHTKTTCIGSREKPR